MEPASIGEQMVGIGKNISFIAAGVSTTNLKGIAGRVCRVCITVAGTTSFTIFDSLTGSGSTIFVSPAATSLGQIFDLQMPANVGITVVNTATGPAFSISWD